MRKFYKKITEIRLGEDWMLVVNSSIHCSFNNNINLSDRDEQRLFITKRFKSLFDSELSAIFIISKENILICPEPIEKDEKFHSCFTHTHPNARTLHRDRVNPSPVGLHELELHILYTESSLTGANNVA